MKMLLNETAQINVMTVSLLCIIMLRHVRTVKKNNQLHTILFTKQNFRELLGLKQLFRGGIYAERSWKVSIKQIQRKGDNCEITKI